MILVLQLFDDDNVAVPVPSYLMTKEGPEPQQDCDSQPQEPGMIRIKVLELLFEKFSSYAKFQTRSSSLLFILIFHNQQYF